MAQLNPIPFSSQSLDCSLQQRILTGEASELGLRPGQAFDQLYDDACDVGLVLQNPRTGNQTRWALSNTDKDGEGDVRFWELVPCPETLRKQPELQGFVLRLFND